MATKFMNKARAFIRHEILNVLGFFSKPAPGVHILNGHKLTLSAYPDTFDVARFERLLNDLLLNGVKFINFDDAVNMIKNKEKPKDCYVAFTWDDGFAEHKIAADVLLKFNVNCCLFINPNFVEGDDDYILRFDKVTKSPNKQPLRWSELLDLQSKGIVIGAHTMDHFMISNSHNTSNLFYQIVTCKETIEAKTGKRCDYFAWPFGRLDHADEHSVEMACQYFPYVFSQSDHKHYYSFDGRVINRRHFEPFWPSSHIMYFINCQKQY